MDILRNYNKSMCGVILYLTQYLTSFFYVLLLGSAITGSSTLDLMDVISKGGLIIIIIGLSAIGLHFILSLIKFFTGIPIIPNIIVDRGFAPYQRLVRYYTSYGTFEAVETVHSYEIKIGAFIIMIMFAPFLLVIEVTLGIIATLMLIFGICCCCCCRSGGGYSSV